ncbi:Ig-like domain repeat protein [Granulicella sp. S190]|uniref:Ig-like domain repeat protein n=1 Tax=Granulicella sp. S190 TaxID=1747226 RepID=UPI00131B6257|nr:Ig-like domain repeat protein [Granulicella sp. S190]
MKKAVVAALLAFTSYIWAATVPGSVSAPARVTSQIDERVLVTLVGNTHRAARDTANDRGAVEAGFAMPHMLLQLKRSPEQEAALQKVMEQMQTPGSASYHSWISEQEFDEQYGVNRDDLTKVTTWLQGHGFAIGGITPDGMVVDFSGTAAMVREAFHTDIHRLELPSGEKHVANMSDPKIPASLASVVVGPTSLSNFMPHSDHVSRSKVAVQESRKAGVAAGVVAPDYTAPEGDSTSYLFTPGDGQTIYNTTPLLAAGHTGKGQTIGLIEDETAYDPSGTGTSADWTTFVNTFGLAKYGGKQTTSFPKGPIFCGQPGDYNDGTDIEVALDIEYATAMAPGANVVVEACQNGYSTFGGLVALENLISADKITVPVLSMSYGFCEAGNGAASNAAFSYAYQHGAARGVSIFVSSGDDGARSCDDGNSFSYYGVGTSGYATTPYNVAVGGTDFGDTYDHTRATYWNATNNPDYSSAKSYIPEIPWNDTCASQLISSFLGYGKTYGATGFCASPLAATLSPQNTPEYIDTVAGSGGPSNCFSGTPDTSGVADGSCAGQPKPSWQKIVGNPNDNVRDIPDVSLFASNGIWGHYIVICASNPAEAQLGTQPCTGTPDTWTGEGGTSASSPMMAGIQTLINDYTKEIAGNPNYLYYSLANTEYGSAGSAACNSTKGTNGTSGCVFHDVTRGDINTPCTYFNPQTLLAFNCFDIANDTNINAPVGVAIGVDSVSSSSYQPTYGTNVGWDFSTGIGSVNAWNLAQGFAKAYGSASPFKATVTLTASVASYVFEHEPSSITYRATVSGSGSYPTGTVTFAIGGTTLGTATLEPTDGCSSSVGSCAEVATYVYAPGSLAVGAYTISATYSSTNENYASAAGHTTLQVVKAGSVADATALTVSPSSLAAGSSKSTFTAKVSSAAGTPDGTVTFTANGISKGVCTLAKGACSISISTATYAAGTYSVVAVYSGSATYESSVSAAEKLIVNKAATTVIPSGTSSVEAGGTVTLVANVARPAGYTGVPTGSVHFYSSTLLQSTQGVATLDSTGKAVYEQVLTGVPAGTYDVIAKYAGDGSDAASNSSTLTVIVTKALTEVTLTSSTNPVAEGSPVSITAVVTHACCSTVPPSGTVAFLLGAKSLGTLNLSSGSAVLSVNTAGLTPGAYGVIAKYSGDATNQPSTRTLSLTVAAPAAPSASAAAR